MKIAKALIIAGGTPSANAWQGVTEGPSQLFPVANRPIIFHVLENLRHAGLMEATILVDPRWRAAIGDAVGDGRRWNLDVRYAECTAADGLAGALATCEGFIGSEPVLVHQADALLRERLNRHMTMFSDDRLDALALRVTSPAIAKGPRSIPPMPGYMLSPHALDVLRGGNAEYGNPISEVRAGGGRVRITPVDACLPCHGDLHALLDGNRRVLQQLARDFDEPSLPGCEIQGPVSIHPTAEVRASMLRGPLVIGPGARVEDTYVGPYTSVGADVVLEGAEIEHSIILPGAELRHVGQRIESSVIGAGARVVRDFRKPSSLRLSLGSGAEVSFS
jgi:glucose-1-phosphate thymidylyltransferase